MPRGRCRSRCVTVVLLEGRGGLVPVLGALPRGIVLPVRMGGLPPRAASGERSERGAPGPVEPLAR
ncbi:MAG: hypothetical protein RML12_08765 [Xanthomonadales bacterium]|nr:hypothetical protein [Xanthomonadales bacterium]